MNDEKINALCKTLRSTDDGVTLNHLRLEALEKVIELNFPDLHKQYQFELYRIIQDFASKNSISEKQIVSQE